MGGPVFFVVVASARVEGRRIEVIDAAVVESAGPGYEPLPTTDGFLVRFAEPSLGAEVPLSIDTTDLQGIATARGLSRLKLSVCGVTPDEATRPPSCWAATLAAASGGLVLFTLVSRIRR